MKILLLITKSNWGGAQKYVYELATGLPKADFDVKVIAGGRGPLTEKLMEAGIGVRPIESLSNDTGLKKEIDTFKELWNIIKSEKPDVLHVNSSKAGIMGALVGRILGVKKIVFTAHGWAFNEKRPLYEKVVLKYIHWLTIVLSHKTIAVSQNIAGAFAGWPMIEGRIEVVYNGIKPGTGYAKVGARQVLAQMYPQLKEVFDDKRVYVVGTIAELHPVKNIDVAINGIDELIKESAHHRGSEHFVYLVIGEGRERVALEKQIEQKGLNGKVFLLGHVQDAYQYIKAFDVFLLPSRSEALAYVLLEAGYQEASVVATAVGGIPEIVEDMKSGVLIQSNKSSEIAHAIKFYSQHADIAKQYAKNLNSSVKEKFTLQKMIDGTVEMYKK